MSTDARNAANAANAQLSTGPRTEEGKARSAQNSTKHGLCSATLVIADADRPAYDEMLAALRADLHPDGALEEQVFSNLIAASWNLHRVRRLLAELYDGALDPLANPELDAQIDRLCRYEQRFERAMYRAIAELRKIQTDAAVQRAALNEDDVEEWSPLVQLAKVQAAERSTRKRAASPRLSEELQRYLNVPLGNGFVSPYQDEDDEEEEAA